MSKVIAVLSKIHNLKSELARVLPNLEFKEIQLGEKSNIDQLLNSEIIVADPDLVNPFIKNNQFGSKLKWIQSTWAGIDAIIKNVDPSTLSDLKFIITRFSGNHFGRIMAEYTIMAIVNHERNIYQSVKNKENGLWDRSGKILDYRIISDLTIGILGLGQISSCIAEYLHSFGAKIWSYGRSNRSDDQIPKYVMKYVTGTGLTELLQNCDYIINVLPANPNSIGLLNGNLLENCKEKQSIFINIGRGSIINENDLIEALNKKWISGAILDVFESEPLPKTSPLWNMSQVFITPHTSGTSRAKDIAEQFALNYDTFTNGKTIPTTVDFRKGY